MRFWRLCLIGSLLPIALLTGCGTPGAPQLPSLQLARPVEDLTASRKGNQVTLDWTLPQKNTDRTLVKHIPDSRICRHEGLALMGSCTQVGDALTPKQPPVPKGMTPPAIHMHYVDTLPPGPGERHPAGFVMYAVEVMNTRGRSAGLSNQVWIPVAPTIAPPEELSADVNAEGVRITWEGPEPPAPPEGLTYRYRILRRPAAGGGAIALGDVDPSAEGRYLDKTSDWEQKYAYSITTVTAVHSQGLEASIEGAESKPVVIFTRDIYPPGQPSGVQAVFSSIGQKPFIDVTWAPDTDTDLAGYNVFRKVGNGEARKLNQQPITVPSFRDSDVEPGKTYSYFVSAVDLRGNESARSAEATETVPDKW